MLGVLKIENHVCVYDLGGGDCFNDFVCRGAHELYRVAPFCSCNAPSSLKSIIQFLKRFVYDLFHDRYVGHACMKLNDFNVI